MEHILEFCSFCAFMFPFIQSAKSTISEILWKFCEWFCIEASYRYVSEYNLSKRRLIVKCFFLFSCMFIDTRFCESILLPTENTLKKSFEATFFNAKRDKDLDEKDHVDSCCRTFHKCDAYKHIKLNHTTESYIRHYMCTYLSNMFEKFKHFIIKWSCIHSLYEYNKMLCM